MKKIMISIKQRGEGNGLLASITGLYLVQGSAIAHCWISLEHTFIFKLKYT